MKDSRRFSEDKRTIGTPRYASFQRMCNEAGLFAIKEAQDRGLPITYVENEDIIIEYADGRKEILGHIKPDITLKKRVYKIL